MVKKVVALVVEELATPALVVALVVVSPVVIILKKTVTPAERNPSSNPIKTLVMVLEEEV